MKISIVTVAYLQPEATMRLLHSAVSECHEVDYHIYLHAPAALAACEYFMSVHNDVNAYDYEGNRGLAKSWNDGILTAYEEGADVVIVVNDDYTLPSGDLDKLAEMAFDNRDRFHVAAYGQVSPGHIGAIAYGCFALNPIALEKVGCFDENFFPIYWEDMDYARRAALAGLDGLVCTETFIQHTGKPSSHFLRSDVHQQNAVTFELNRQYYARKWGGEAGQESYLLPFDNLSFDYRIPPESRHAPYGKFDRTDQEIVKL